MLLGGPYHGLRVLWQPGAIVRAYSFDDGPKATYRLRGDGRTARLDQLTEFYRRGGHEPSPPG